MMKVYKRYIIKAFSICRRGRSKTGIALLMALSVVLLLSVFMSEFFFSTGLELRAMSTFRESHKARGLANSVFKATRIGLLMEETAFFQGYEQIRGLLQVASVPWDEGLLLEFEVKPLDHLVDINELAYQRVNSSKEKLLFNIFFKTLADVEIKPENENLPPEPIEERTIEELYAAVWDWLDRDDIEYTAIPGVNGAEAFAYLDTEPEIVPKNSPLDRLDELRLVKGLRQSPVTWDIWEARFAALPRRNSTNNLFNERVNINLASHEEILLFLQRRKVEFEITETNMTTDAEAMNQLADNAGQIADRFVPEDPKDRKILTPGQVKNTLKSMGLNENFGSTVLSTINQYYTVEIVVEVNEVKAKLEAMVHVDRNPDSRVGTQTKVLWQTLR